MKKIIRGSGELAIATFLTSKDALEDPKNHCVPILDYFNDDKEPYTEIIVMPILRPFGSPPFIFVDEVVDFVRQSLEVWQISAE